jgi:UPF0716 protein FxsA
MPPLWLLAIVFIVVPLAELYVILAVGDAIGVVPTLAILVLDSLLGSWLLRQQGRAVWRRFNDALRMGRIPQQEVVDGVLVIFGGAFLITPGFITDVIGLALLIPPSRRLFQRFITRRIRGRVVVARVEDDWVEGSAHEVDRESRQLRR